MFKLGDRVVATKTIGDTERSRIVAGTKGRVMRIYKGKFTKDGLARTYPYDVEWDTKKGDNYPVKRDEIKKH